jgi:hypothetical protein
MVTMTSPLLLPFAHCHSKAKSISVACSLVSIPSQLDEARENLEQFLGVIFRISERQAKDVPPEAVAEPVKIS